MPAKRKRPDGYHHGDLRRGLLDAALAIIEEDGVAAVTIRALARRLGVSHAAPAHHFPDRGALLVAVATEGFAAFADALEQAAAGEREPRARFRALGRAYLRFAADHPAHLRLMFGRGLESVVPSSALLDEGHRAYAALTAAVAALAPRSSVPIDERAFAAWALVHGMAVLWIDGATGPMLRDRGAFLALADRIVARALLSLEEPRR